MIKDNNGSDLNSGGASITWQSEVTPEQWEEWMKLARKLSGAKRVFLSLGQEDYAAQAIEKLLMQENRPANIQAWLALTINRQYIDRFRKTHDNGKTRIQDLDDDEWPSEMAKFAIGSPSLRLRTKQEVDEVLAVLTDKEKEILIMSAAGFDNHEIAVHFGYRTNKIVATRLGQISEKVKNKFQSSIAGKHGQ